MKKIMGLGLLVGCAWALFGAPLHEHALYEPVPLDGTWEMAYQPYAWETVDCPSFTGVPVEKAVPGYWEDMVPSFRAAGMKDKFRINPLYEKQTFPITGWASDTTLPNIYGCFFLLTSFAQVYNKRSRHTVPAHERKRGKM